jgi:ribonuclease E
VEKYSSDGDCFDHYRVSEGIHKALERKVWLPSGGSLVIDRTEAMTVVDVNTGKFVGTGGNLEETVTKNNLEAAEEIARQLRLRDIGGIIVIDFIDMVLESNRDLVLRRLMECLSRDRTKHQVAEVTSLGLVQMTRKRVGLGLLETFSEPCEHCQGRGVVVHAEPVAKPRSGGSDQAQKKRRSQKSGGQPVQTPHQLTDDARMAIAQIAAKTVGAPMTLTGAIDLPPSDAEKATGDRLESDDPLGLGIPLPKKNSAPRKRQEKPGILDAVLNALPEPPVPGSSRRRRRASSQGIVTAAVEKAADDGGDS